MNRQELLMLLDASRYDWAKVDPTIFGSLLEGLLGKDRRDELGTHYTHEIDIMKIVTPSIVRPWRDRIEALSSPTAGRDLLDGCVRSGCSTRPADAGTRRWPPVTAGRSRLPRTSGSGSPGSPPSTARSPRAVGRTRRSPTSTIELGRWQASARHGTYRRSRTRMGRSSPAQARSAVSTSAAELRTANARQHRSPSDSA